MSQAINLVPLARQVQKNTEKNESLERRLSLLENDFQTKNAEQVHQLDLQKLEQELEYKKHLVAITKAHKDELATKNATIRELKCELSEARSKLSRFQTDLDRERSLRKKLEEKQVERRTEQPHLSSTSAHKHGKTDPEETEKGRLMGAMAPKDEDTRIPSDSHLPTPAENTLSKTPGSSKDIPKTRGPTQQAGASMENAIDIDSDGEDLSSHRAVKRARKTVASKTPTMSARPGRDSTSKRRANDHREKPVKEEKGKTGQAGQTIETPLKTPSSSQAAAPKAFIIERTFDERAKSNSPPTTVPEPSGPVYDDEETMRHWNQFYARPKEALATLKKAGRASPQHSQVPAQQQSPSDISTTDPQRHSHDALSSFRSLSIASKRPSPEPPCNVLQQLPTPGGSTISRARSQETHTESWVPRELSMSPLSSVPSEEEGDDSGDEQNDSTDNESNLPIDRSPPDYIANIPAACDLVTDPPKPLLVSRHFLVKKCKVNGHAFIHAPKNGARYYIFPQKTLNPYVPEVTGEGGLLFAFRRDMIKTSDDKPFSYFMPRGKPNESYAENVWEYKGEYRHRLVGFVSTEEFINQDAKTFHKPWAQDVLKAKSAWARHRAVRERIKCRKDDRLDGRVKGEPTYEDFMRDLREGKERMGIVEMRCVGYDHDFANKLHDELRTWVPLKRKYPGRTSDKPRKKRRVPKEEDVKSEDMKSEDVKSEDEVKSESAGGDKSSGTVRRSKRKPKPNRYHYDWQAEAEQDESGDNYSE